MRIPEARFENSIEPLATYHAIAVAPAFAQQQFHPTQEALNKCFFVMLARASIEVRLVSYGMASVGFGTPTRAGVIVWRRERIFQIVFDALAS